MKAMKKKRGQDNYTLGEAQTAGGHAGRGQGSGETGGPMEPTTQKPVNEGKTVADVGEYRGSQFQTNRAAAHKVSQ